MSLGEWPLFPSSTSGMLHLLAGWRVLHFEELIRQSEPAGPYRTISPLLRQKVTLVRHHAATISNLQQRSYKYTPAVYLFDMVSVCHHLAGLELARDKAGLRLAEIFLPHPPKHRVYRHEPPCFVAAQSSTQNANS